MGKDRYIKYQCTTVLPPNSWRKNHTRIQKRTSSWESYVQTKGYKTRKSRNKESRENKYCKRQEVNRGRLGTDKGKYKDKISTRSSSTSVH